MRYLLGCTFFFALGMHIMVAQLSLPKIFTNNMVLQRDTAIHIWGKGIPNTALEVQFGSETISTTVRHDTTWNILFKGRKANAKPQTIQIKNEQQKIILTNILIGDLWLCIGQSNMEWPMEKEMHFNAEVKNANQPSLRFYNPNYAGKDIYNESFSDSVLSLLNTKNFYKGNWAVSDSNSVRQMSAVGYYFGKEILEKEHIPIGLINMAIGGAPIEAFVSNKAMESDPKFIQKLKGNWLNNQELPVWVRERGQQNVGNIPVLYQDPLGPNHAFKPGFAYTAGIEPMLQMPIKGILWYQGESNAQEPERVNEYGELQKLMIEDYRNNWKQPKLPFYWVQLSTIDTAHYNSKFWPEFRNVQRKLLDEVKHGGMAVTSDIGAKDDVHPTNKKDVGERLGRWALNFTYRRKVIPSGPLPKEATYKNGRVIVDFKYSTKGLKTSDNNYVKGFSLNGKTESHAILNGSSVEIPSRTKPKFVYYSWQSYTDANLVNSEGLPTSTFKIPLR